MNIYWTLAVEATASRTETFSGLSNLFLKLLRRMKRKNDWLVMVSSQMFGLGGRDEKIFRRTIELLQLSGVPVFDYQPLEPHLLRIREKAKKTDPAVDERILEKFYLPIFKSGLIQTMFFFHSWKSSGRARWEHQQTENFGIQRVLLPEDFHLLNLPPKN